MLEKCKPLEAASSSDLLFGESSEHTRYNLKCGIFIVFLQPIVLLDLLAEGQRYEYDFSKYKVDTYSAILSSAVVSSSRANCMTRY